jgi:hypothetical protein
VGSLLAAHRQETNLAAVIRSITDLITFDWCPGRPSADGSIDCGLSRTLPDLSLDQVRPCRAIMFVPAFAEFGPSHIPQAFDDRSPVRALAHSSDHSHSSAALSNEVGLSMTSRWPDCGAGATLLPQTDFK